MSWHADQMPDLTGRTAVVTGANSGLGRVCATELARHGATVVLAVRQVKAGEAVAASLPGRADAGHQVVPLDLAAQASIAEFAEVVDQMDAPIDLLINNAGVMSPPRWTATADGHELQFGTNHLGHFALTARLLPRLLAAPAPRVTTVSSLAHARGIRSVVEGNPRGTYNPVSSYGNSKLANLLFALELERRARAAGSTLVSNAAHPGTSNTNLFTSRSGMGAVPLLPIATAFFGRLFFSTPEQGAESVLYAATLAPGGSYTGPTGLGGLRGDVGAATPSALARDTALAADLWERSEALTGLHLAF